MDSTVTAGPPIFQRVLLKMSGESFCRPGEGGINLDEVSRIARQTARVAARGVQLAIVVGGGNILRGAQLSRGSDVIKEATAHYMGMMATVINGLALQDALEKEGLRDPPDDDDPDGRGRRAVHPPPAPCRTSSRGGWSSWRPGRAARSSRPTRRRPCGARSWAPRSCSRRRGSTASTRPTRRRTRTPCCYEHLTYDQVLRDELKVMDMTAIGMCMENGLPILVFNFKREGNIERAIAGEPIGTWVSNKPRPGRPSATVLDARPSRHRDRRLAVLR